MHTTDSIIASGLVVFIGRLITLDYNKIGSFHVLNRSMHALSDLT